MARFAPVAPIQILEKMKQQKMLGTYHLLLTHHILEYPDRFHELFRDVSGATIIVDNSVVELGDAASDQKVYEACKAVQLSSRRPNWITPVLTDVMNDGPATREVATESYLWWVNNAEEEYPLMVVLQGQSWEQFCRTADYFLADPAKFPQIEYVGIPRVLVSHQGTRQRAIQYVQALNPMASIHLLGFSDNVTDDIICSNMPDVEGIDSAVPLRYAYSAKEGQEYYTPTSEIPPRPEDWFEKGNFTVVDEGNLHNIRKWVA